MGAQRPARDVHTAHRGRREGGCGGAEAHHHAGRELERRVLDAGGEEASAQGQVHAQPLHARRGAVARRGLERRGHGHGADQALAGFTQQRHLDRRHAGGWRPHLHGQVRLLHERVLGGVVHLAQVGGGRQVRGVHARRQHLAQLEGLVAAVGIRGVRNVTRRRLRPGADASRAQLEERRAEQSLGRATVLEGHRGDVGPVEPHRAVGFEARARHGRPHVGHTDSRELELQGAVGSVHQHSLLQLHAVQALHLDVHVRLRHAGGPELRHQRRAEVAYAGVQPQSLACGVVERAAGGDVAGLEPRQRRSWADEGHEHGLGEQRESATGRGREAGAPATEVVRDACDAALALRYDGHPQLQVAALHTEGVVGHDHLLQRWQHRELVVRVAAVGQAELQALAGVLVDDAGQLDLRRARADDAGAFRSRDATMHLRRAHHALVELAPLAAARLGRGAGQVAHVGELVEGRLAGLDGRAGVLLAAADAIAADVLEGARLAGQVLPVPLLRDVTLGVIGHFRPLGVGQRHVAVQARKVRVHRLVRVHHAIDKARTVTFVRAGHVPASRTNTHSHNPHSVRGKVRDIVH